VDGQARRIRACEVLVSNTTLLDAPPHLFVPPETLNDGPLEAYMVTAHTFGDYLYLLWDLIRHPGHSVAKLFHLEVKKNMRIESVGRSQLVQADGEVIGHTPVEIQLVLKAIHVIMSKPKVSEAPA
jgi:diacylglycerol kinase family enzyme